MKCVECGQEVAKLFEEPVKGNITLTICANCNKTADKYIEYEYTLIFLNLILCKPQVYRHILFNINFCETLFDLFKLFLLSCFMDTILCFCDNLECWSLQYAKNIVENFVYLSVIVIGAYISGIKFKKLRIVRAVLVASFGKLGAFMIVTWKYSALHRGTISFFIYLNNIIAVKECLESSYLKALTLILLAVTVSSLESTIKFYWISGESNYL